MAAVMASPATAARAGAGMRLLRTTVFTAVCVALAAAGHTLASGATVPAWSLALGWLAVFSVVAPLAGRERTMPGICALLAAGQIALHLAFGVGQVVSQSRGAHTMVRMPAMPDMPGMTGMLAPPGAAGPNGGGVHCLAFVLPLCSLPMLLGHLLAAVAAGWLLRRGEAALWRVVRLSVRGAAGLAALSPAVLRRAHALLSAPADGKAGPLRRGRRRSARPDGGPRTVLLRHSLARRGPPAAPAA
jgi:hypothetical protein